MWCSPLVRDPAFTRRVVRRFTLGSGPLKRTSDRLQVLSRSMVAVLLLAAVPIALAVGLATRSDLARTAARQAAERHEVTATLLTDAPPPIGPPTADVPETAVWTGPRGATHVIQVPAQAGAVAGEVVTAWVNGAGQSTEPPLSMSDVDAQVVIRAMLAFLAAVAVATGAHCAVVATLNRRRARQWAAEWEAIEPGWAGRLP